MSASARILAEEPNGEKGQKLYIGVAYNNEELGVIEPSVLDLTNFLHYQ